MALPRIEISERPREGQVVKDGFLKRMGFLGQIGMEEGIWGINTLQPSTALLQPSTPLLPENNILPENNVPLLSATTVSRAKHTAIEVQPGRVLSSETFNLADAVDAMFAQAFLAK